jgi:signal transduction histidine kinase
VKIWKKSILSAIGPILRTVVAGLWLGWIPSLRHLGAAEESTNIIRMHPPVVDGKSVPLSHEGAVSLGPFPKNVVFRFGLSTNASRVPMRLRHILEGYDNSWHNGGDEMLLAVRFFNESKDQIGQSVYQVRGESAGWNGSLRNSPLTHRRETLDVPALASRVMLVISSAGPPSTLGIYVVANLSLSKSSDNMPSTVLIPSPFDAASHLGANDLVSANWIADGTRPSMAKIVEYGKDATTKAFAILDEDPDSHAEWRTSLETAPKVAPGDRLVVEWNEMFSIGVANETEASYSKLPPGNYHFQVAGLSAMGIPTGEQASLAVVVPEPFWRLPWFWTTMAILAIAFSLGGEHYLVWRRLRREMFRLKHLRMIEEERLRIARDIHDDLGARVTQISLLSAMAHGNPKFPETARKEFDRISRMSRDLVSALYETVWAVNPENDNMDALANYLCQTTNQLCEQAGLRCRLHVLDLSSDIQVSSQVRHNVSMAVKEAVHNAIKHAKASEVAIHVNFSKMVLTVAIQDNGCGFRDSEAAVGNGLTNMKRRLHDIGGNCLIASQPGGGTKVEMSLTIHPAR